MIEVRVVSISTLIEPSTATSATAGDTGAFNSTTLATRVAGVYRGETRCL